PACGTAGGSEPRPSRHDLRGRRIRLVVRRHDLYAMLVEGILDVRVQRVQDRTAPVWPLEGHQQRVLHVEVLERCLEDHRFWFAAAARRSTGGPWNNRLPLSAP